MLKIYRQVFSHPSKITYSRLSTTTTSNLVLFVFADSSWRNHPDGRSQQGFIIGLGNLSVGGNLPLVVSNVFCWSSKKSVRVARSSLNAELVAAGDAIDRAKIYKLIIEKLKIFEKFRFILFTDAKDIVSRLESNNNNMKGLQEKMTLLNFNYLKECCEKDGLEVIFIKSHLQVADCLTKVRASPIPLLKSLGA